MTAVRCTSFHVPSGTYLVLYIRLYEYSSTPQKVQLGERAQQWTYHGIRSYVRYHIRLLIPGTPVCAWLVLLVLRPCPLCLRRNTDKYRTCSMSSNACTTWWEKWICLYARIRLSTTRYQVQVQTTKTRTITITAVGGQQRKYNPAAANLQLTTTAGWRLKPILRPSHKLHLYYV